MAGMKVKHHPPALHGEIIELEPELGHGWLEADDGRKVYFQPDSLIWLAWDRLQTGTSLRFREISGEKRPYVAAVTVAERA